LFVWKAKQITGLTRLLTLALRLLTLLETQVQRGLAQTQEPVAGQLFQYEHLCARSFAIETCLPF
jgi:transposase